MAPAAKTDFNPRAPYGARRVIYGRSAYQSGYFNPRAPYGARLKSVLLPEPFFPFQSTRPIRGATHPHKADNNIRPHFNPRAPYGARLPINACTASNIPISIHAPHTGRDFVCIFVFCKLTQFQSTRPIRGATCRFRPHSSGRCRSYFNPRAPYGARLYSRRRSITIDRFQSTRPIRGATQVVTLAFRALGIISIHAPHTGRDVWLLKKVSRLFDISIHAPHTGRDDSHHW